MQQASFSVAKLMQTLQLTQIVRKGHAQSCIIVYTQPLDAAALNVTNTQGCKTLESADPYAAYRSIRQSYDHYHGRRVDFCEGDEGFVCVGSSGKTAKVSAMPSPERPPPLTPKKDKAQSYRLPCLTSLPW